MDLKLGGIDIGVAVLYVVAFAIIGVLANRKVKTAKDFVSAGQSLTLPVVVGTTIATCLGASILFSNYQRIHAFGIDGLVWALAWYVGWMLMLPIAKRLRASGATSLPTFLEKRYNGKTRTISSVFVLVSAISTCASFFLAFGTMAQTLGICDMKTGTIVGAVVIVIFTVVSGLWGVALTDSLQTIIIAIGCCILVPYYVFKTAGGVEPVVESISDNVLGFGQGLPTMLLIGYVMSNLLAAAAEPSFAQRIFASKDSRTAVIGQSLSCGISAVICIIAVLPAFAIPVLYPDMTDGAQFITNVVADYFPAGLKGLMVSVIMGLLLTSGDSYLMLVSSSVVDDFVRPRKPDMEEKKLLRIGRVVIIVAAVVMVLLALYIKVIYNLFALGASAYAAAVFVPLYLGCYWKKANTKAINAAMLCGGGVSLIWDLFLVDSTGIRGVMIGTALSLVICVVGSLLAKRPETECIEAKQDEQ